MMDTAVHTVRKFSEKRGCSKAQDMCGECFQKTVFYGLIIIVVVIWFCEGEVEHCSIAVVWTERKKHCLSSRECLQEGTCNNNRWSPCS